MPIPNKYNSLQQEMVFKFLISLCNNKDMAEELTQETFCRAIESSHRYDGSCKITTWLCQIAKHLWYQELAKQKRRQAIPLEDATLPTASSIEETYCFKEEKMMYMHRVHKLDDISKEVFLLRITGAFSFKEIGEILQKNENWARVTFYRAKQKVMKG